MVDCGLAFASGLLGADFVPTDIESTSDLATLCNAIGQLVSFGTKAIGG